MAVSLPSFFIERMSRLSMGGGARLSQGARASSLHRDADTSQPDDAMELRVRADSNSGFAAEVLSSEPAVAVTLTPFQPAKPQVLPLERKAADTSAVHVLPPPATPVSLAAQTVIKKGALRKHSRNVTGAWQARHASHTSRRAPRAYAVLPLTHLVRSTIPTGRFASW